MFRALLYLRIKSLENWGRWRARRLRQPKYLVGAMVGVAYFYFFFFRRLGAARPMPGRMNVPGVQTVPTSVPAEWLPIALAIGAAALFVVLTFMWVVPIQRAALGFTEAEIAFLFPAPVTRRTLVHFRLLTAQFRSLTGGLIMAIISNRWSFLGGNALTHGLGWWFIFSTLNLHFNGASFTLTRLADRGLNVALRRVLVLLLVVAVVGLTLWRLPESARFPAPDHGSEFRLVSDWLVGVTTAAPLSWLLYPLRLVLGPFLATDGRAFLQALAPGLLVIAGHYLWVVQSVVSFEDASVEQAQKRAARVAAWRSGERRFGGAPKRGRRPPFRLGRVGRPEIAFGWKNLLSTRPYFNLRVFGACALGLFVLSGWARTHPGGAAVAAMTAIVAAILGGYVLVIGAQFARQDIRGDFQRIDILKTYPLAGWQIVLGEMLTPAAILTGIIWLCLLGFVLNLDARMGMSYLTPAVRVVGGIAAAVVVPPLVMLQLFVPNAAALVFPSWAETMRSRGGGPEVMGQRMIYLFAQALTMLVVLLPAAIMGAIVGLLVQLVAGLPVAIGVATIPVVAVLVGEVALGVWWLGGRFEKIDVAEELRS